MEHLTLELEDMPGLLRRLRKESGLTTREVADRLGLKSAASISHYELNNRTPSERRLQELLRLYGYAVRYAVTAVEQDTIDAEVTVTYRIPKVCTVEDMEEDGFSLWVLVGDRIDESGLPKEAELEQVMNIRRHPHG